jgi:hypothetical protein
MRPQKTQPEAGSNGEPENEFLNHLLRILLGPYGSENSALDDRHRLMDILALNSEYLRRSGADTNFAARDKISFISVALSDLDEGVTHPMFKANNARKAPLNSGIWRLRAVLAIALDYLVRAREPLETAAGTVARTPGIEQLLSGRAKSADARKRAQKSDAGTSVIRWRNTLRRGEKTNKYARMAWEASRETLASIDGPKGLRREAARLIGIARRELRTLTQTL